MDLVRYADGTGNEFDYEYQGSWQYRDYLVRAFNADLPYDRFVREQIAGDLLPATATGGCRGPQRSADRHHVVELGRSGDLASRYRQRRG